MSDEHVKFVLLRTTRAIQLSADALSAFDDACRGETYTLTYTMPADEDVWWHWDNGVALKIRFAGACDELAEALETGLNYFEAWAMYDRHGDVAESFDGLVSQAIRPLMSQVFLFYANRDRDPQRSVDKLRSNYPERRCRPAFHFRDGQVLFVCPGEPARTTIARCRPELGRFAHWSILDQGNESHDPSGFNPCAWEGYYLPGLAEESDEGLEPEER